MAAILTHAVPEGFPRARVPALVRRDARGKIGHSAGKVKR